jgi:hypothetical protein
VQVAGQAAVVDPPQQVPAADRVDKQVTMVQGHNLAAAPKVQAVQVLELVVLLVVQH